MIPTQQTILHDPANGRHGNCFSAVIASLLHIPIEDIPTFSSPYPGWIREVNAFLKPYGLAYMQVGMLDEWVSEVGITGLHCEVFGTTQRSDEVLHACVGIDGKTIFDPHPGGSGLKEVQGAGVFIALNPWSFSQRVTP